MKKKIDPKVSDHFRKLGNASWKARQKKILEEKGGVDNSVDKRTNVV